MLDFQTLLLSVTSPVCIGFSIMTGGQQIKNALEIAATAKELYPNTTIVFGGPHVNILPEETLKHQLVDCILTGPGQTSFPLFLESLHGNIHFEDVPGLMIQKNGQIICGRKNVLTTSTMVPYNFNLVDITDYIQNDPTISERTINYISTQGCAYKCKFCYETNYERRYSKLPTENVISDIKMFVNDFAINGIKFYDADWFIDPNRTAILIDALTNLEINWAASIHPKDILHAVKKHTPLLEKLSMSKCKRLLMGIESGNNRVLKDVVDKGATKDEIYYVAEKIAEYGILGSYTFIVGFPGETREEQEETFDFIQSLWSLTPRPETRVHIYTPYPGTQLYQKSISMGFIPPDNLEGWSDFNYYKAMTPWTNESLEQRVFEFTSMRFIT